MTTANALRLVVVASFLASGCKFVKEEEENSAALQHAPAPMPAQPAIPDSLRNLHFIVDLSDRKLYVVNASDTLRVEDVAVGTKEHPTPTGEWGIKRVDFNPDWTPPPGEDWTEDKEPQDPGAPENPMGRARLVFNAPYTIHGTAAGKSLGTATSHGSIRVANVAVIQLARMVIDAGGASKPESFYQEATSNATVMQQVDIPNPVPITIRE